MITRRSIALASALAVSVSSAAYAAPPTKEECVEAHGKGQDARESGQLGRASKLFLTCAQSTCPDLVRSDCARFVDELTRLQPTVTFAAREGSRDLPDTSVWVDGNLVASSLGDGKAYDVDPGRHEVKFIHGSDETTITIVVAQGEKGRAVVGTFGAATPAPSAAASTTAPPATTATTPVPDAPEPKRPAGPLVLTGLGAAAVVAGAAMLGVGFAKMPASCSLSTHTCAAPPNDPKLDQAGSAVTMMNLGGLVSGAGAVVLGGSLIWYFAQPLKAAKSTTAVVPWIGPGGGGIAIGGRM
jgi:hypothetical protein